MFCNFFYVLLGVLLCCCCFVSEGRSGNHVLQEVELDGLSPTPQLLNLPLTVLSLGIKSMKMCTMQCLQDWLAEETSATWSFLHGHIHVLFLGKN